VPEQISQFIAIQVLEMQSSEMDEEMDESPTEILPSNQVDRPLRLGP